MTKKERELLDDIFLQPWFLSRQTAFEVKRILPPEHRHKMRFYFEDYGCLRCGKRDVQYGSNGLCKSCMQQVKLRLFFAIKRRWTAANPENRPQTFKRMADAQRLLKDLIPSTRRRQVFRRKNPVGSTSARATAKGLRILKPG
jgi:hypothetical protein